MNSVLRYLSSSNGSSSSNDNLFNIAIAVIFAREMLEGCIIIGNYRTAINKSNEFDAETKKKALQTVTRSAAFAISLAVIVVIAVAVPLGILSRDLNENTVALIEGISKVVASFCIVQLSVKLPVWLGVYWKVSIFPWKNKDKKFNQEVETLSLNEIRFNVVWNIWREVAECGVFLIPFFLGTGAKAIPISAVVGIGISLVLGIGIYVANHRLENRAWLAIFMSGLTLFLSVGLFVGGCHEFEEIFGDTKEVYSIERPGLSDSSFPMVIFTPFGYSSERSVLQITTFWLFLGFGLSLHFLKWRNTQIVKAAYSDKDIQSELPIKDLESPCAADVTQDLDKTSAGEETQSEESLEKKEGIANNNDDVVEA